MGGYMPRLVFFSWLPPSLFSALLFVFSVPQFGRISRRISFRKFPSSSVFLVGNSGCQAFCLWCFPCIHPIYFFFLSSLAGCMVIRWDTQGSPKKNQCPGWEVNRACPCPIPTSLFQETPWHICPSLPSVWSPSGLCIRRLFHTLNYPIPNSLFPESPLPCRVHGHPLGCRQGSQERKRSVGWAGNYTYSYPGMTHPIFSVHRKPTPPRRTRPSLSSVWSPSGL